MRPELTENVSPGRKIVFRRIKGERIGQPSASVAVQTDIPELVPPFPRPLSRSVSPFLSLPFFLWLLYWEHIILSRNAGFGEVSPTSIFARSTAIQKRQVCHTCPTCYYAHPRKQAFFRQARFFCGSEICPAIFKIRPCLQDKIFVLLFANGGFQNGRI